MTPLLADALTADELVRFHALVARFRRHRETLPPDMFARLVLEAATSGGEFACLIVVAIVNELDPELSGSALFPSAVDHPQAIREGVARVVELATDARFDRRLVRSRGRRLERALARRPCEPFASARRRSSRRPRARAGRGRRRARAPCAAADDDDLAGPSERVSSARSRAAVGSLASSRRRCAWR
jgi:hypothetical protein